MHPVIVTNRGTQIVVDLIGSPAGKQVSQQPYLLNLAKEVLISRNLTGDNICIEEDIGRNIGLTEIVSTSDQDTIIYAKRLKSNTFTRFVRNRSLMTTTYLTIELLRTDETTYQLYDIHAGQRIPVMPDNEKSDEKSIAYWSSHAVIWGNWPVQSSSITKICPWQS